jgi:hypothetical protein
MHRIAMMLVGLGFFLWCGVASAAGWCCEGVSLSDGSALEWCDEAESEAQAAGKVYTDWFNAFRMPDPASVTCRLDGGKYHPQTVEVPSDSLLPGRR